MGYSSRYHAASLAAVFLALAIGILIGVGFGNSPRKSLERSLKSDLEETRADADRLGQQLNNERDFGKRVYPALTGGRLRGERIGLIGLGGLSADVSNDIEDALQPTGAELTEVAAVRMPPDLQALADGLSQKRFPDLAKGGTGLDRYGQQAGRQLVLGSRRLLRQTRDTLLSRASGRLDGVDNVIVVRNLPADLRGADEKAASTLEKALVSGMSSIGKPVIGVERSTAERSSVGFFDSLKLTTVDDVDLAAGRVAMVFALLGAEGHFGVKGSADRLLPELLVPSEPRPGG